MYLSVMSIAMLAIAAGQSVDIGTDCECSVTVVATSTVYELGSSHGSGECARESTDPLDMWSGVGVEFGGGGDDTFDFRIDCARPCSISQVNIGGSAWCGGDTTLQLFDGDRTALLAELDTDINDSGQTYYEVSLTASTDYLTSFRVVERGDGCGTWNCRTALSIVGEVDPSYVGFSEDCDALPIDTILSKCSANYAATGADILALQSADNTTNDAVRALQTELVDITANHTSVEARLRAIEAWQDTLLSMSAAKGSVDVEDMGPSPGVTVIDLSAYAMEALVVCLVMVNVVLLWCLCSNSTKIKNRKVVYAGVRGSDQEELCA